VTAAVPNVSGDHEYGGYIATRRLLDLGHRRIAYARHFQDVEMLTETRRWRGHLRALAEAGLLEGGEGAARILSVLEWRRMHAAEGAAERLRAAYRELDSPTAVACWTDHEAGLLLPPLTAAGLSVPGDVSLIGYDNVPLGESLSPSLDTVDPHTDVLVRRALDLLGDPQTADPGFAPQVSVTPTLHPRHSCAPPKKE
jgi:LacI family transcriptional regulator